MANPTPYERGYSFSGFQSNSPQTPLPGSKVDVEFDNIERTTTDIIAGLADVRRSDGRLKNGIVTLDSLSAEVTTGIEPAVAWTTATDYEVGAVVFFNTGFYRALVNHVSGVFANDFAAGKWYLFADLGPIVVDAGVARDQAVAAAGAASSSASAAASSASSASGSAGSASSSASSASTSAGTATTQAGIASTQAANAAASAAAALASQNAAAASAATVVHGFKVTQRFSAADGNLSAGQTSFTVPAYDTPYGYVYRNGSKLVNGVDVTFPTGTTFLLASGVGGSDHLEFEGFGVFNVANLAANQVAYSNTSSGLVAAQAQSAIDELASLPLGQCVLSKSGSNVVLTRLRGRYLTINGRREIVPGGGVSLAPTGLTVSTLYYVYAYMNSGVMTLEASTTGHATDATTGVEIKSGDATRTLVGMVYPVTGPAFADTAAQRLVASWFNRSRKSLSGNFTTTRTTASTTYAEINSEIRVQFLSWASDAVQATASGAFFNSAASTNTYSTIGVDSTTVGQETYSVMSNQLAMPIGMSVSVSLSEGFHFATLLGKVSSGTGSWFVNSNNAGDRTAISGSVLA